MALRSRLCNFEEDAFIQFWRANGLLASPVLGACPPSQLGIGSLDIRKLIDSLAETTNYDNQFEADSSRRKLEPACGLIIHVCIISYTSQHVGRRYVLGTVLVCFF